MTSDSIPEPAHIDKVRASREGHTYHDTWTARVALELLVPTTDLAAVAVEGFSTEDAQIASAPERCGVTSTKLNERRRGARRSQSFGRSA
jgi:hypothetical protein